MWEPGGTEEVCLGGKRRRERETEDPSTEEGREDLKRVLNETKEKYIKTKGEKDEFVILERQKENIRGRREEERISEKMRDKE